MARGDKWPAETSGPRRQVARGGRRGVAVAGLSAEAPQASHLVSSVTGRPRAAPVVGMDMTQVGADPVRLVLVPDGFRPVDGIDLVVLDALALEAGALGQVLVQRGPGQLVRYHVSEAGAVLLLGALEAPMSGWVDLAGAALKVALGDDLGPDWEPEIEAGVGQLLRVRGAQLASMLDGAQVVFAAPDGTGEIGVARSWVCAPGVTLRF